MNTKNILLAILCVLIFAVGFFMGRVTAPMSLGTTLDTVAPKNSETSTPSPATQTESASEDTSSVPETETIDVASQMTESQKNLLRSFGLNPDEVTITAEMVACAETKVGASRVEEIKNGATPSFMEGASLLACYSQ